MSLQSVFNFPGGYGTNGLSWYKSFSAAKLPNWYIPN